MGARGARGALSSVLNSGWSPRVLGELGLRLKGPERHAFLMRENSGWDGRLASLACLERGDEGSQTPEDPAGQGSAAVGVIG